MWRVFLSYKVLTLSKSSKLRICSFTLNFWHCLVMDYLTVFQIGTLVPLVYCLTESKIQMQIKKTNKIWTLLPPLLLDLSHISSERELYSCKQTQIWAAAWQNKQNNLYAQQRQISLGIHPVWSVFAVRMKNPWVLSYPLSAQRRLWSDWMDASLSLLFSITSLETNYCKTLIWTIISFWFLKLCLIECVKSVQNLGRKMVERRSTHSTKVW